MHRHICVLAGAAKHYYRVFEINGSYFGVTFQRGSGLGVVVLAKAKYAEKSTSRRRPASGGVVMGDVRMCYCDRIL